MVVPFLESSHRNNVNTPAKKGLEVFLKVQEVKQRTSSLEENQKINVADFGVIASCRRTENRNGYATVLAH